MKSRKKKSGDRKHGRNKIKCQMYRLRKKHELSHIRRLEKHQKLYKDSSPVVLSAIEKYRNLLKG